MPEDKGDILSQAVARNAAVVLSLPSAGMLRHHKSRFLGQTAEGLWIESVRDEILLIDQLLVQKIPVGVSFKAPPTKASFAVPILRRQDKYQFNVASVVDALLLQTPDNVKALQRRNNYRVRIPEGAALKVRVWRIADHVPFRDRPLASQMISVKLNDLSVGGLGVALRYNPDDPRRMHPGQRLRIELAWEEIELILEGVLRLVKSDPSSDAVTGGIEFKKLENDLAGRQAMAALTRIVGEFQREEVRRCRLGL